MEAQKSLNHHNLCFRFCPLATFFSRLSRLGFLALQIIFVASKSTIPFIRESHAVQIMKANNQEFRSMIFLLFLVIARGWNSENPCLDLKQGASEGQCNQFMFTHIPNEKLFVSQPDPKYFGNPPNEDKAVNWLKSRFHFSFAEYHDPKRQNFGVVRVINDDLVQPNRGFGTHPHSNMEIVTYIIEGEITHQDSNSNKETLGRGSIQYMSAGTGVQHSEFNHGKIAAHFLQIWINPRELNTKVTYGSYRGAPEQAKNKWLHLVGDQKQQSEAKAKINQDCNIFVNEFTEVQKFELQNDRQAYLVAVEGQFKLNDQLIVKQHDGVEIYGPFKLQPDGYAHVLVLEMKKKK